MRQPSDDRPIGVEDTRRTAAPLSEEATVEIRRRPRRRWPLVAAVAALLAGLLALGPFLRPGSDTPAPVPAGQSQAGQSEARQIYQSLEPGMSRGEVEQRFGGPGEEISWRRLRGETIETYAWDQTPGYTVMATFRNDALIRKSEIGRP